MNIDEMLWKLQLFPYSPSVYFPQVYVNSFQPDFINYSFKKKQHKAYFHTRNFGNGYPSKKRDESSFRGHSRSFI